MSIDSTEDLFVSGLKHAYHTEQRLVDALAELEQSSSSAELQSGFAEHRSETETHVDRLEEVFDVVGESPEAKEDPVVEGMITAHEEFVDEEPSDDAIDRYNIAAGHKAEHYEIATYGNLIPMADALGYDDAADLLEENLREEQAELDALSELSEEFDYEKIAES